MSFETEISVRFGDEDHARVVYYPRFFDFFHRAFEDFFSHQGHPYLNVLDVEKCGWPSVKAEAEFHTPARLGDRLVMQVEVIRIGKKSASFRYRGRRKRDAVLVVTGAVTVVCIDTDTFESKMIPDVFRELFSRHLCEG